MMKKQLTILYFVFCFGVVYMQKSDSAKAMNFIRSALDEKKYDKAFRPENIDDPKKPLDVDVIINIINYGQFSPHTMRYSLLMEVEQIWYDQRLKDTSNTLTDTINIGGEVGKVWVPDLYFPKSVEANLHTVTVPNSLMWLEPNGKITYVQKLTVTLGCSLNFLRFPMDNQDCQLDIGSFGFKRSDLNLQWHFGTNADKNILLKKRELNEFKIIKIESTNYKTCGKVDNELRPCIQAKFHFRRELEYHFMHTFGPNILIVVISWLSFLIDYTVAPARTAIGLISVLTLITQTNMVYSGMPKISYIKAVDIWLLACLMFVVGALLEFAFVNSLCREGVKPIMTVKDQIVAGFNVLRRKNTEPTAAKNDIEATKEEEANKDESQKLEQPKKKKGFTFQKSTGYKIDGFFFVMFPIIFLIFNIVYWSVYLSLEE